MSQTHHTKFIFVTGGVLSSLGKGVSAAAIGAILETRGLCIEFMKLDPYINVDPGTMSPFQHGEVFVTEDGAETDLDLGHYERFVSTTLTRQNNITTGQIYDSVITKERNGDFLGKTVQVIPHITNEIKDKIKSAVRKADIFIVEIGGTVGDIESLPFLEALRQMKVELGKENVLNIHVTLVPYIKTADELKTKPTQHSVKELRMIGVQPDIILCRTDRDLPNEVKQKISLFTNVAQNCVFTAKDMDSVYDLPVYFHEQGVDDKIVELLNIWARKPILDNWIGLSEKRKQVSGEVTLGLVGKYVDLRDSYKSLNEALSHGALWNMIKLNFKFIDSELLEQSKDINRSLTGVDGILVPGGFGSRGIEGKIRAIEYARVNKIPFLGICLGMQLAVIEFSRHVCGMESANSTEFNPETPYPVIALLPELQGVTRMGGTMRLGAYECSIRKNTLAYSIYKSDEIRERHRHRWEFNNDYLEQLVDAGLIVGGVYPKKQLVETIEIKEHPWFFGCQFHPEFKSRPVKPHPIFSSFVKAMKSAK